MPTTAIHPGEHLGEELKALGMSASEPAHKPGVPPAAAEAKEPLGSNSAVFLPTSSL